MKIIKTYEIQRSCHKCKSLIEMLPHEIHTVSPPGPYDMDYEPSEIGKKYWYCPVCKAWNWIESSSDDDDY